MNFFMHMLKRLCKSLFRLFSRNYFCNCCKNHDSDCVSDGTCS